MNKLNDFPYQKILFDGKWGIGKTKSIMESTNDKKYLLYFLGWQKKISIFYQGIYYLLLYQSKVKLKKH